MTGGRTVYYVGGPVRNFVGILMVFALAGTVPHAQGHASGDRFVAFRAGANVVGNTFRVRETKAEPGAGGSIGTYLSRNWALEFETWIRASNPAVCCDDRRHETLYSLGVMRLLASGRLQPYMLGGLTLLNADETELQVQLGLGLQIPVHQRFDISMDLRGNGGGNTMIVRPTAALIYHFR